MNTEKFLQTYNETRNGTEGFTRHFTRHLLCRNFAMSDGVIECAEAGTWWLMDILASELPSVIRRSKQTLTTVTITVKKDKAEITLSGSGDVPLPWKKSIGFTDMPEGVWTFLVADELDGPTPFRCIMVSEN